MRAERTVWFHLKDFEKSDKWRTPSDDDEDDIIQHVNKDCSLKLITRAKESMTALLMLTMRHSRPEKKGSRSTHHLECFGEWWRILTLMFSVFEQGHSKPRWRLSKNKDGESPALAIWGLLLNISEGCFRMQCLLKFAVNQILQ